MKWLNDYQSKCQAMVVKSEMPSFRHGLSITVKPAHDFADMMERGRIDIRADSEYVTQIPAEDFFSDDWVLDKHKLHYVHDASVQDFIMVQIPPGKDAGIIHLSISAIKPSAFVTVLVLAGKASKSSIRLHWDGEGHKGLVSESVRIIAKESSRVEFIGIQALSNGAIMFQTRTAKVSKDASVDWIDLSIGGDYLKSSTVSRLQEPGAESRIKVIYSVKDRQRFDIFTGAYHDAEQTNSDIVTKGVLHDSSKALSRGLISIGKNAAGSQGYEKQDALIMGDLAEADAIPNLEIHNHDVKCSHGSTIGQVDAEKLFYIMSRGLSETEAKSKIVEGYFAPVLDKLDSSETRASIEKALFSGVA